MNQPAPRERLGKARRIVIKIGTNVICRDDGELAAGRFHSLVEEIADAHRAGKELILVSSGSISLGARSLGRQNAERDSLSRKQALAAIGQSRLMTVYQQAFDQFGLTTAQVLLTESDFAERTRYLNLRNTLTKLLEFRAIPIVNENDTISTLEIETVLDDERDSPAVFGDNDVLSALVASKLGAELLIVLSNVDGLHRAPPDLDSEAPRVPIVESITPEVASWAQGSSKRGRGGMRTKLRAAEVATRSGTIVVIASGRHGGVISSILRGDDVGTVFLPKKPLSSRKRWIGFATNVAGRIHVNAGARAALVQTHASLLFAGVCRVDEEFEQGAIVGIVDENGEEFARGVASCPSTVARRLAGRRQDEIAELLDADEHPSRAPEVIHRDSIVILRE